MPWIDEIRKRFGSSTLYIQKYSVIYINSTYGAAVVPGLSSNLFNFTPVLSYQKSEGVYKIDSNKNYMFKHNIIRIDEVDGTGDTPTELDIVHFLDDDLPIYDETVASPIATYYNDFKIELLRSEFSRHGYLDYCSYYNNLSGGENKRAISYYIDVHKKTLGSSIFSYNTAGDRNAYINNFEIVELDFFINGFKKNICNPDLDEDNLFDGSSGWYYNEDNFKSYGFKKDNNLSPINPYYEKDTDTTPGVMCDENFISIKINSDTFNAEFRFDDRNNFPGTNNISSSSSNLDGVDKLPNLRIYLVPSIDFERWRSKEVGYRFKLSDYSELSILPSSGMGSYNIRGFDGKDKYLLFNIEEGETALASDEIDVLLSNFKITGEYADDTDNNVSKSSLTPASTSDISFEYNDGTNIQTSFVGNGKFLSGIWENGVWNNGVRTDSGSFQFDDVLNSYPISDGKWRIEISKSSLLSTSERNLVGEFISIGNIVVININEERKFLKKSYLVVDAIDNYIAIEAEFSFPVRRIERDSDKHRIKVSKNVWLSGAFLSGKFEGIWNDGVFKGNPSNNVMDNTQWIDGVFDGGRFKSKYDTTGDFYNLSGDFHIDNDSNNDIKTVGTSPNEINNILYAKLSANNLDIVPLVGGFVNISGSKHYDGDSKILEVEQVGLSYNITIDKEYLPEDEIPVFSPSDFGTTGVGPSDSSLHDKLLVKFDLNSSTIFNIGDFVRIYNVSSSTITGLNLPSDIGTTDGKILEVLDVIEENISTSTGQQITFDQSVSPYAGVETSAKLEYPYLSLVKSNLKLLISNGLIQNFTFNDNNLSKLTSNNSISSTTVFKYNSWIDVNYDNNEAVNIGRDTKVNDSITGVNTSNNNLYGYPTSDVLSSKSKFRGSNTLNSKIYNLGTKFKKYTDFLGDSSLFEDPFDTNPNPTNTTSILPFTEAGWSIDIDDDGAGIPNPFEGLQLKRTSPSLITEGKELKIDSYKNGGILNNEKITLEKSRYSIIEFDLIDLPSSNKGTTYISLENNTYPILSFSNLNYETKASFADPLILEKEYTMDYLPINKNVNLLNTSNSKKVEYFFNKKHLNMDIKGYNASPSSSASLAFKLTIDNLKIYEVDMIPFFKYFNESNIFKGIQKPLVGTSPFIEYTLNRFPFIESQSIPFDSIDIKTKE